VKETTEIFIPVVIGLFKKLQVKTATAFSAKGLLYVRRQPDPKVERRHQSRFDAEPFT